MYMCDMHHWRVCEVPKLPESLLASCLSLSFTVAQDKIKAQLPGLEK